MGDDWPEIVDDTGGGEVGPSHLIRFGNDVYEKPALLNAIAGGWLPDIVGTGVMLQAGEREHVYFDRVSVYRRECLGQEHVARHEGLYLAGHDVGLHLGQTTGRTTSVYGNVCLGVGRVVLTSKRLAFLSADTSFGIPWHEVLHVTPDQWDTVRLSQASARPGEPPLLLAGVDAMVLAVAITMCRRHAAQLGR